MEPVIERQGYVADKKKFCPYCTTSLENREIDGRERLYCRSCPRVIYENPVPSSAVVLFDSRNRVLLTRRSVAPKRGEWCLPGGFLELEENVVTCALRELREETALEGEGPIEFQSVLSDHPAYRSVLVTGVLMTRWHGTPRAGDDASEVRFFSLEECPPLAFRSHRILLRKGCEIRNRRMDAESKEEAVCLPPDYFGAYVITSGNHAGIAREACAGGARVIQYRAEGISSRRMLEQAKEIRRITRERASLLIVNNYLDIALAVDADGVHVGQRDLPTEAIRRIAGPDFLVGRSTHSLEQALEAQRNGADYIGYGPLFKTPTKPDYPPVGIPSLLKVLAQITLPVVAIGGIDLDRIGGLSRSGVTNVAMVREFAADTRRTVSRVNRLLGGGKKDKKG